MKDTVILRDVSHNQWLEFSSPRAVVVAHALDEVMPALERVEAFVAQENGYAAGFISYEAAPAFDAALRAHAPTDFPLVWFGLYDEPRVIGSPLDPLSISPTPQPVKTDWTPNVSREEYNRAIARVREYIARGDTYQVNYTMRLRAPFHGEAWPLFLHLVRAQPNSYAAYVDTGRYAICSASPELFLRREGNRLTMKPMKGTAPRGRFLREDRAQANWLHHSEKNRAENVMIVDMARNDLGRVAEVGSVQVTCLWETERYPTVWQMTSTVEATSEASLTEIFRATFPCASITGAPKARTMEIIRELEPEPRGIYTGVIGFVAPENPTPTLPLVRGGSYWQFNVAIRTAVVDREKESAEYGVGGGVVWDSTASDEYAETRHKARVLTEMPREFSLLESLQFAAEQGYWLLDYHLRRLRDSADYFDFAYEQARVVEALERFAAPLDRSGHKVRLLLARDGKITLSAQPLGTQREPVRLALAQNPVQSGDKFLFHKTTQRAVYDAALAGRGDADDVLLWNERGEVTETCNANIVAQFGDEMFTPPVECGLLNGTFRAALLDEGKIRERVFTWQELIDARALWRINSVRGWQKAVML